MRTARTLLALFDLDGTLVRPGSLLQRLHMDAMAASIASATGIPEPFAYRGGELFYREVNLAGFTDAGTIRAALVLAGASEDEAARCLPGIVEGMVERLDRGAPEGWNGRDDLLPGAREVLEGLHRAGVALGMSTGNARAVAAWKMRATGLADLLRDGGFGDRATEREDVAAAGAKALTPPASTATGVLVGDTVRDVTAARAAGLRCLAVSTGAAAPDELRSAGADLVLPGLQGNDVVASLLHLAAYGTPHGIPARDHAPSP